MKVKNKKHTISKCFYSSVATRDS